MDITRPRAASARPTIGVVGTGLRADVTVTLLVEAGLPVCHVGTADELPAVSTCLVVAAGVSALSETVSTAVASGARVVVVSDQAGASAAAALVLAGAGSVLTEDVHGDDLVQAVHLTSGGFSVLEPSAAVAMAKQWRSAQALRGTQPDRDLDVLTARESEVLRALAEGLTGKAVARKLGISLKTVEVHKASIFARLGVRTQVQAVALAVRAGIGDVPASTDPRA